MPTTRTDRAAILAVVLFVTVALAGLCASLASIGRPGTAWPPPSTWSPEQPAILPMPAPTTTVPTRIAEPATAWDVTVEVDGVERPCAVVADTAAQARAIAVQPGQCSR